MLSLNLNISAAAKCAAVHVQFDVLKAPLVIFLSVVALLFSCKKDKVPAPESDEIKTYLHLSHTRTNANPNVDASVETMNFEPFEMLWLGGDLAYLTSEDDATMQYVDSIFDLGNENTLWSLGNHDYTDLTRVENFTGRPAYYTSHRDGITYVVLDTQDSLSNIIGAQKDLLINVLDTINASTHLVVLHHKLIWMYDNPVLEPQIASVSNAALGTCFYCINPNNFYVDVYPLLVAAKQRGVEVLCVGGDIGFQSNEFEFTTPEGVHFLASGIKYGTSTNKALIFTHNLTQKTLDWEFKLLSEL